MPQPPRLSILPPNFTDSVKTAVKEALQEVRLGSTQAAATEDFTKLELRADAEPTAFSLLLRQLEAVHVQMLSESSKVTLPGPCEEEALIVPSPLDEKGVLARESRESLRENRASQEEESLRERDTQDGSLVDAAMPTLVGLESEDNLCCSRVANFPMGSMVASAGSDLSLWREGGVIDQDGDAAIKVTIIGAKNLRRADWGPGELSTPYCICEIPGKPATQIRTRAVLKTLEPVWHHEVIVPAYEAGDSLRFTVWDEDFNGKSADFLGSVDLDSSEFLPSGFKGNLALKDAGKDDASLKIEVRVAMKGSSVQMAQVWQQDKKVPKKGSQGLSNKKSKALFGIDSDLMSCADRDVRRRWPRFSVTALLRAISPDAPIRLLWDIIGIFILMIDLAWIPMQVFKVIETDGVRAIGWLTLMYWTLDVLWSFNTGFYTTGGGQLQLDRFEIAKKYLKSWFLFDFFLIAIDWVQIFQKAFGGDSSSGATDSAGAARAGRIVRVTRIIRLLRLMRLAKLRQLLFVLQTLIDSEWLAIVFAISRNMGIIMIMNHAMGCMWFLVGNNAGREGWVRRAQMEDADYGLQYLASLHWSLSQFTPGSSPLQPKAISERVFVVVVLMLAMVLATCFISSITSTMGSVWEVNRYKNTQTFLLKKFLTQMKISRELGARVTRYVDGVVELRHKKVPINKVEYLKLLSGPLNVELYTALFKPHLEEHPFFFAYNAASRSAMRRICSCAVHSEMYAKNDTVFEKNSEAKMMYFPTKGALAYRYYQCERDHIKRTMRLGLNQWCSEPALWIPWRHRGHMKGLTDCEMFILDVSKFWDVTTKAHGGVFEVAREEATRFAQKMQCFQSFGRAYTHDIPPENMALLVSENWGSKMLTSEIQKAEDLEMELIDFSDSESENEDATDDPGSPLLPQESP